MNLNNLHDTFRHLSKFIFIFKFKTIDPKLNFTACGNLIANNQYSIKQACSACSNQFIGDIDNTQAQCQASGKPNIFKNNISI